MMQRIREDGRGKEDLPDTKIFRTKRCRIGIQTQIGAAR
jgi:hypothetical protein